MLCYRCEHRAKYLEMVQERGKEKSHAPRCECQDTNASVYSCYMFKPCMPVVLAPNEGDTRPRFAGAMISSREHFVRTLTREEVEATVIYKNGEEIALGWELDYT